MSNNETKLDETIINKIDEKLNETKENDNSALIDSVIEKMNSKFEEKINELNSSFETKLEEQKTEAATKIAEAETKLTEKESELTDANLKLEKGTGRKSSIPDEEILNASSDDDVINEYRKLSNEKKAELDQSFFDDMNIY